jgi:hypothetical protein
LAAAIIGSDFTDAGHTVAVVLGVLVSSRFRQPIHWTPVRRLMLAASSGFGFLMLAHHWGTMAAAPAVGLIGAYAAHKAARFFSARKPLRVATVGDDPLPVAAG